MLTSLCLLLSKNAKIIRISPCHITPKGTKNLKFMSSFCLKLHQNKMNYLPTETTKTKS